MTSFNPHYFRQGFTFIEFSIVLVIVGLIVGGILMGKDLINTAEIRAQIVQADQFKAAMRTFQTKYNALPGDIAPAQTVAFGFEPRSGADGDGDGDGRIEGIAQNAQSGELLLFWKDLASANMVSGSFPNTVAGMIGIPDFAADDHLPKGKVSGTHNYLLWVPTAAYPNCNRFTTYLGFAGVRRSNGLFLSITGGLKPEMVFAIDIKIDDIKATSGKIRISDFSGAGVGRICDLHNISNPPSVTCAYADGTYNLALPGNNCQALMEFL